MPSLLRRLTAPFAYRRLLRELSGCREQLTRIADVLELQAQVGPRAGQSFRSLQRGTPERDDSRVSYVDQQELGSMLAVEARLKQVLGRDPDEAELERAFKETFG